MRVVWDSIELAERTVLAAAEFGVTVRVAAVGGELHADGPHAHASQNRD